MATLRCESCIAGACCTGSLGCAVTGPETCENVYGGVYLGDNTACPGAPQVACCLDDQPCRNTDAFCCGVHGGTPSPLGDPHCLGDWDGDGVDEACAHVDEPCECGPGPHWVDQCAAGMDNMSTGALIGIDITGDCEPDASIVMNGPVHVLRSDPLDDSMYYPGLRPVDGHLDVIDTEIISMNLAGGGVVLRAGLGQGMGAPLSRSVGAIAELTTDPALAGSFFDVFFEIEIGDEGYLYNHEPLRVESVINCVPPVATYVHPDACLPLYDDPTGGQVLAYLVTADHSTYPGCGDSTTGSCLEPNNTPYCDDRECCETVCDIDPYCCDVGWDGICVEEALEYCVPQACCNPENHRCVDVPPAQCRHMGGVPQGPGMWCLGDLNGNGMDDLCEPDDACDDCGPGHHWVDECAAGTDHMSTGALVGIDMDLDCQPDTSLVLSGPVYVYRSDPMDDSLRFPGLRSIDGHLDVIDTEMLSMSLSGGGITLTAGYGFGQGGVLWPTFGAIAEHTGDDTLAESFFNVYFEVDLGGGVYAYNRDPMLVASVIDCVPPDTTYIHPIGCIPLYDSLHPGGVEIARLVTADHSTYPDCGDPTTGDCFEPNGTPYCDIEACCRAVCEVLPHCCDAAWDVGCVEMAYELCHCPEGPVHFLDPPNGFYDARQPTPVLSATPLQGVDSFLVAAPSGKPVCWDLCETNHNPHMHVGLLPNGIANIIDNGGGTYLIRLNRPITHGEVTTLRYRDPTGPASSVGWFWYLPGDANRDWTSAPADVLAVIDYVNGVTVLPVERCDMDRDGTCAPADILRVIDLLNGAGVYDRWHLVQINPQGCP